MEIIYKFFSSRFYGGDLTSQLNGLDGTGNQAGPDLLFFPIFVITLIIVITICFVYYYILNHPRLNRWYKWLIFLAAAAIFNFFIAFGFAYSDLDNIFEGLTVSLYDCLGFGFANAIVSAVSFVICSLIIKWWSRNCRYSPFVKF